MVLKREMWIMTAVDPDRCNAEVIRHKAERNHRGITHTLYFYDIHQIAFVLRLIFTLCSILFLRKRMASPIQEVLGIDPEAGSEEELSSLRSKLDPQPPSDKLEVRYPKL